MKQKITFLLLWLMMISSYNIYGQREKEKGQRMIINNFVYNDYYWEKDEVIGFRSSMAPNLLQNPVLTPSNSVPLFTGFDSQINFTIAFTDIDYGKCSINKGQMQFPSPLYEIKFTSNNVSALFDNNSQEIIVDQGSPSEYNHYLLKEPYNFLKVFRSNVAILNINNSWNQNDIKITVKITDISSTMMPDGHTGNPDDFSKTFTWTIKYQDQCPTRMQKLSLVPENTWTDQPYNVTYRVLPLSTDFEGTVITEFFGPVKSGGMFSLTDIRQDWLDLHPNVINEDIAAEMIFVKPLNYGSTFMVDANNQFKDTHDGIFMMAPYYTNLRNYFYPTPIQQNKAGYKLEQTYKCSNTVIGKADLYKRYKFINTSSNATQFKKIHNF